MRNCFYLVLVLLVAVAFTNLLQAQTSQEERLLKLEEICKQQEEQIQKLQGRLGLLQDEESYKKYTENIVKSYLKEPVAEEDEGVTAGYENGFFIRSADRNFELNITGYLQAGLGVFENNTYDNNSFYANGIYTNFDVTMFEKFRGYISINYASYTLANHFQDGASYDVALIDAFLEYKLMPEVNIAAGKMLVPFGLAGQYYDVQGISIWNEPFVNAWSHGRDLGMMVHGTIADRVEYKVGVFNGEGSNFSDEFLMAGQLRFYFCKKSTAPNSFFHVGFLRNRDNRTTESTMLLTSWGRPVFGGPGGVLNPNDTADDVEGWRTAVDTGARLDLGFENGSSLRLEGEFMYSTWQRDFSAGRESWLAGYGFWLGYAYRHCFDKKVEGSGLLHSVTFSYADIDNKGDSGNIRGQSVMTITAGLGYAFNNNAWFSFNWVMTDLALRAYYGGSKYADPSGKAGGLEHAWFLQFTTAW